MTAPSAPTAVRVDDLTAALRRCWSAETSADTAWSPANPALGQCCVSALVVQDHLGGSLLRGTVGDVSHYWNQLPDGTELDTTREQFPAGAVPTDPAPRDRLYVLSYPATVARYEQLRAEVAVDLSRSSLT